jgi:tetratricopeptide (TPR) repeat protein
MVQDAEAAEYEGRFADAAALYEKMIALRPDAASSYVGLALVRARLQDFPAAVAVLRRGLDRIPDSEILMTRLGYTYLVMSRAEESASVMQNILKINPRSMDALTGMAVVLESGDRKAEAIGYYEKALAIEPENKFVRLGYAGNLASSGRLADAVKVYDGLIRDYPKDVEVWRALGAAYGRAREFDKAIEAFKGLIAVAPDPDAWYALAMCYREKGDAAEAIRHFERFLGDPGPSEAAKIQSARAEMARLKASIR